MTIRKWWDGQTAYTTPGCEEGLGDLVGTYVDKYVFHKGFVRNENRV